jgi:hypothetical protein
MDYLAKTAILESPITPLDHTKSFPLKPISIFIGRNKVTPDEGEKLRFWVHRQLARVRFHEAKILFANQFNLVDWEMIYTALCRVPRMFQIWACKQVMGIAPAN